MKSVEHASLTTKPFAFKAAQNSLGPDLSRLSPPSFYRALQWDLFDLDGLDAKGLSKIAIASELGNVPVVQDLLARGADFTKRCVQNTNVLHFAASAKHDGVLFCLLGTAVGRHLVNGASDAGQTPLMRTSDFRVPLAMAKALIPLSDLTTTDKAGLSFRDHARHQGRDDILSYLDLLAYESSSSRREQACLLDEDKNLQIVLTTLDDIVASLPQWVETLSYDHLLELYDCWQNLLRAHRHIILNSAGQNISALHAIHAIKALRMRVIQQKAEHPQLSPDPDKAIEHALCLIKNEHQNLFLLADSAALTTTNPSLFPWGVRLLPFHLEFVALKLNILSGETTPAKVPSRIDHIARSMARVMGSHRDFEKEKKFFSGPVNFEQAHARFEALKDQASNHPCPTTATFCINTSNAALEVLLTFEKQTRFSDHDRQTVCMHLNQVATDLEKNFDETLGEDEPKGPRMPREAASPSDERRASV